MNSGDAMSRSNAEVLISGASVAGPVLAYWLRQYGFTPVVVERTPELRRGTGGHAVDLMDAAAGVADRMGLWAEIRDARTRTAKLTIERPGRRPVDVDLTGLIEGLTERHAEVMRGELAEILYRHTRDDVEYRSATRSARYTRTAAAWTSRSSAAHPAASTW
jgi:2-polyprenyl-6-methoxyphenol hydroxylase-like FAD-dependent oxidoreductase